MKSIAVAALVAVLPGCVTAQMVEDRGVSQYAPEGEREGGRIKYVSSGLADLVRDRREDAYRQMFERCGGRYRIVSEYDQGGATITQANANATAYGNSAYGSSTVVSGQVTFRLIDFECTGGRRAQIVESSEDTGVVEDENADYVEPPPYRGPSYGR